MHDWRKRNWLVTGTSQGFGRAFVEAVLAGGGKVAAFSRSPQTLDDLKAAAGERLWARAVDITDPAAMAAAVADLEGDFGGIDVLVNNAGYGLLGGVEECSDEQIRDIFTVNLLSAIDLTRAVLPGMRARRRGFVINFSSVSGVKGIAGSAYYAATKFGLEGFTDGLRQEMAPLGIGTMIVEPGPFRTGFMEVSRVRSAKEIDDYTVVAKRRQAEARGTGVVFQDPARGVEVILRAMEAEDPPGRLALGGLAVQIIGQTYREKLDELDRWGELGASADQPVDAS